MGILSPRQLFGLCHFSTFFLDSRFSTYFGTDFSADFGLFLHNPTPPPPGPFVPRGDLSGGLFISTAACRTLSFSDFFMDLVIVSSYFGTWSFFSRVRDFVAFGVTQHHHHQTPVYHGGSVGRAFYLPASFLDFVIFRLFLDLVVFLDILGLIFGLCRFSTFLWT